MSASVSSLSGQVVLVTGASRGIGRSIAIALGEAGATVYVTGRSAAEATARLVSAAGGRGVAAACDHRDDSAVARVFQRVMDEAGRLDVLVNNATGPPDLSLVFSDTPFWDVPTSLWTT